MTMISERIKGLRSMCSFRNLRKNWFFPVAAAAFFCLNFKASKETAAAIAIAFLASIAVAACSGPLLDYLKENRRLTAFSLISSVGICIGVLDSFTFQCLLSEKFKDLLNRKSYYLTLFHVGRIACCAASVLFVCFFLILFWKRMLAFVRRNRELLSLTKTEIAVYSGLFLLSCIYVIYAYSNSMAFYDTRKYGFIYNTIYTSDSAAHFQPSAYLWPAHEHNDLRQPLFAVFAAPFMGIPYLLGCFFSTPVRAIVINCAQVAMLLAANLMIVKSMRIKPMYRICFMVLSLCMYSNLLFSVMMEQYIVAYFWLAAAVFAVCCGDRNENIQMLAAGGTMLPSFAMLLLNDHKDIRSWLRSVIKTVLEFVFLLAVFCKSDIFLTLFSTVKSLTGFTGKSVPFADRLYQFSDFIRSCFAAPEAGVEEAMHLNVQLTVQNHAVWSAKPVTGICVAGVVILCLALLSAVMHRKNKACAAAGFWMLLSIAVLVIAGWGTAENGLILYTLYFGWAYLALLFQLAVTVCEKLKAGIAVPVISAIACLIMLVYNIPAVQQLFLFAFRYYPV